MLSLTCKTAIKAVVFLSSKSSEGDKLSIKEVSSHIDASEHSVGKILQQLVRQGIIKSAKGPTGGFYMEKEQLQQPLIDIVLAIEGKSVFKECGLGLSKCSASHPCPIHNDYKEARDLMEKLFKEKKIIDLCGSVQDGLAYLVG